VARFERRTRRKVCKFCVDRVEVISLRDERRLGRYVTDRGKLVARRISGTCAKHQRELTGVIKQARFLAILPYTADQGR
jgi:small subunit ribosomal protein S18